MARLPLCTWSSHEQTPRTLPPSKPHSTAHPCRPCVHVHKAACTGSTGWAMVLEAGTALKSGCSGLRLRGGEVAQFGRPSCQARLAHSSTVGYSAYPQERTVIAQSTGRPHSPTRLSHRPLRRKQASVQWSPLRTVLRLIVMSCCRMPFACILHPRWFRAQGLWPVKARQIVRTCQQIVQPPIAFDWFSTTVVTYAIVHGSIVREPTAPT